MSDLKRNLEALRLDEDDRPRRGGLWAAAVVLTVTAAAGAGWFATRAVSATEVTVVRPTLTDAAEGADAAPVLTAAGYVVARREAVVSAKIQGRLSELLVEEGSTLARGDVIARLESADYEAQVGRATAQEARAEAQVTTAEAQVQRAEADLAEARRQLQQAERLAEADVVARDALESALSRVAIGEAALAQARAQTAEARAQVAQAQAELAFAQAQLQNTVIRAPFAGTVVRKMAEVGESVAPIPPGVNISTASGAVVALADLDTLEMEADISESNVAKLSPGQTARVSAEAFPDREYRAVLRQIIPTADRTKATVQVKVTILDRDPDLKPEMSAKVTFLETGATADPQVRSDPRVYIPQTAVVSREGRSIVFEVVDGRARERVVELGAAQASGVLVQRGLTGAEQVVAAPPPSLRDGDQVRVKG